MTIGRLALVIRLCLMRAASWRLDDCCRPRLRVRSPELLRQVANWHRPDIVFLISGRVCVGEASISGWQARRLKGSDAYMVHCRVP
jgi:hypothetical protein